LYHYTSSAGLVGIIQKGRVWFSDCAFMNDGSEIKYGMDLFKDQAEIILNDKPDKEKNNIGALMNFLENQRDFNRQIIFCMSDDGNLLNQWRDYGKDVTAYSIEFDTYALLGKGFNFRPGLFSLIYDRKIQSEIMHEFGLSLYNIDISIDYEKIDEETRKIYLMSAAAEATFIMSHFKNPAFGVEQEWRFASFVTINTQNPPALFRASNLGVVPYYEWYRLPEGEKLPITSVMVGPSPYAQASDIALKLFLAQSGYNEVQTRYSTIPIRA